MIILISGKAEDGKDSYAVFLKEILENTGQRVIIIHFADYLKFICLTYMGWDGEKNEKGRKMLQQEGTERIRKRDPSFWVETVVRFIKVYLPDYDYFIIPDTRFLNEIETIKENFLDVVTVRIKRTNYENSLTYEQRQHRSETELDTYGHDYNFSASNLDELKCCAEYLTSIIA